MKVLFMFGGLPHYYNLVLNRLNRIPGLKISVVVPQDQHHTLGAGVHQSLDGIEFTVHRLPEYRTFYGKAFFKDFGKLLQTEKPDVIVTCWPYVLGFVYRPGLRRKIKQHGIKLIMKDIPFNVPRYHAARQFYREGQMATEDLQTDLQRNSWLFRLKYDLVTYVRKLYYNLMDAHVNYIEDAYDIIGSYGVDKRKIFIIYNSPDTDAIFEVKEKIRHLEPVLPPNPQRLLHVGRLVKWKRVDMLLDVFSRLRQQYPGAELVVVGTGPEEVNLRKKAEKLQLGDSVKFVGGVYEMETLGQYFMAAAVYVLAGLGGLSINEAMCFDKPIVCSEADGTEKKLVRHGFNGLYFEKDNAQDLYEKLDTLLTNPDLIRQMGERSGRIIRQEVNIYTVIDGYVRAFNFVTNNRFALPFEKPVQ